MSDAARHAKKNLSYANLSGSDLTGHDLHETILRHATLSL